jgi:ABC-2 type transport system ATP-binding protein/capsular polysaccharide transport system ATP-binding protein
MITVDHISKVYPTRTGQRVVLDDISFKIERGEKLGILGRNGAGKSTLIRLVSGAERPTSGQISQEMSVSWPLAFGGAFQNALTGLDNVRFISRIYKQDYRQNLDFVSDFTELGIYLREPVRSYSSGMRARLAFAISMIIEFECYLIDEISAVGDAKFHEKCATELFHKRGDRAMFIISHDTEYIRHHCGKFAVLNEGKLLFYSDFDQAIEAHGRNLHLNI